jgi:hypothetical protein
MGRFLVIKYHKYGTPKESTRGLAIVTNGFMIAFIGLAVPGGVRGRIFGFQTGRNHSPRRIINQFIEILRRIDRF